MESSIRYGIYLILLSIVMIITIYNIVEASTVCYVPSTYANVEEALANGCNEIYFDGDVYEVGPIILDADSTMFNRIYVNGSGFKWVLPDLNTYRLEFYDFEYIEFSNINISFQGSGFHTLFERSPLNLTNVTIHIYGGLNIFNIVNSSLTVYRAYVYKHASSLPFSIHSYGDDIYMDDLNVYGYPESYAMAVNIFETAVLRLENSYLEGLTTLSVIQSPDHSADDSFIQLMNNVFYGSGYSALYVSINAMNVSFNLSNSTFILNPLYGGTYGIFISVDPSPESVYINISNVNVYGLIGRGTVALAYEIGPYKVGVVESNVVNFLFENIEMGIFATSRSVFPNVYTPIFGVFKLYIENGSILSSGFSLYLSNPLGTALMLEVENLNTTSLTSQAIVIVSNQNVTAKLQNIFTRGYGPDILIYYYGIFFPRRTPPLNNTYIEIVNWIANRSFRKSETSLEIFTLPNQRLHVKISKSLFGRFSVYGNASIFFNESVYREVSSQASGDVDIRSRWTLNVRVLSSYTGYPVPNIRVDLERNILVGYGFTDYTGNAFITLDYDLNTSDPFIEELFLMISTSYFRGRWGYYHTFGYNYTLPSWYGYILLRIPILYVRAVGHLHHIPISLEIFGDYGVIYLYKSVHDLIQGYLFGIQKPVATIYFKISNLYIYGVYLELDIEVYHKYAYQVPQKLYIIPRERIIYSPGLYELIARY